MGMTILLNTVSHHWHKSILYSEVNKNVYSLTSEGKLCTRQILHLGLQIKNVILRQQVK